MCSSRRSTPDQGLETCVSKPQRPCRSALAGARYRRSHSIAARRRSPRHRDRSDRLCVRSHGSTVRSRHGSCRAMQTLGHEHGSGENRGYPSILRANDTGIDARRGNCLQSQLLSAAPATYRSQPVRISGCPTWKNGGSAAHRLASERGLTNAELRRAIGTRANWRTGSLQPGCRSWTLEKPALSE